MILDKLKNRCERRDISPYGKRNIENSIAMLFHENSKLSSTSIRVLRDRIERFYSNNLSKRATKPYKCYPGKEVIDLSSYKKSDIDRPFSDILVSRRSLRSYNSEYEINASQLSSLLYYSYGVIEQSVSSNKDLNIGLRTVPSAGGLYPLELYVLILNGTMPSGLYHYRADNEDLELIRSDHSIDEIKLMVQSDPYVMVEDCSAIILTTAVVERLLIKYGDRGYRFILQESGMVAQNISLIATALGLGSCILGGYDDFKINRFIGVDGVFEAVNNLVVIGKELYV